jgi:heme A synthase
MLAAGSLRFWSQLGAGMALTLVFVGYGLVIWRGPWAATRQQQQLDLLGQGQIAAALMVLVALVCVTGMKLGLSAGKDGVKADVERDDEPPTVTTTTTTQVKP